MHIRSSQTRISSFGVLVVSHTSFISSPLWTSQVSGCGLFSVHPSFRALSGRLKFTVRGHKFNEYSLSFPYILQFEPSLDASSVRCDVPL